MNRWFPVVVVVIVAVGGPRRAAAECVHAPCFDYGDGRAALVVIGAAYAAVTIPFMIEDLRGENHSRRYGLVETLIHAPITLAYASFTWGAFTNDFGGRGPTKVAYSLATLLHGALAIHGIRTMVRAGEGEARVARKASLTPVLIPDGAGLGYGGTF